MALPRNEKGTSMLRRLKANWGLCAFDYLAQDGTTRRITVNGRDRWALQCLMEAGPKGCTQIDTPGPRWSAYKLRLKTLGLDIEKITEPHDGPFPGHHARYVLKSRVVIVERVNL